MHSTLDWRRFNIRAKLAVPILISMAIAGNGLKNEDVRAGVMTGNFMSSEVSIEKNSADLVKTAEVNTEEKEYIFNISNADSEYKAQKFELSDEERNTIGQIIRSEAGTSFEGQALIAQSIRDTAIYYESEEDILCVIDKYQYACNWEHEQNENTKKAIEFIFDDGKAVVQHKICFFYNPDLVESTFHESQTFVIEYGGHRYFSKNKME